MVSLLEMGFSAGKRMGGGEADARENNFRPVSAHLDREGLSFVKYSTYKPKTKGKL